MCEMTGNNSAHESGPLRMNVTCLPETICSFKLVPLPACACVHKSTFHPFNFMVRWVTEGGVDAAQNFVLYKNGAALIGCLAAEWVVESLCLPDGPLVCHHFTVHKDQP
jgi:hypothetical protein